MTVALGFLSACSESRTSSPETVATDSAESVTLAPITAAPTLAPTTVPAPTTTIAPRAFLRSDGLGPFDFGDSAGEVLTGMPLGTVLSDDVHSFPTDDGDSFFESLDGTSFFTHASERTVCWDDGVGGHLCAYFGGADEISQALVGWEYSSTAGVGPLFSASGATINILVSAVPLPPVVGECYGFSFSEIDGISLNLQAPSNETFGTYHDDGTYTLNVPAPAAWISLLRTGDQPEFFGNGEGDC